MALETHLVTVTVTSTAWATGAGCGVLVLGGRTSSCLHTVRYVFFLFWFVLLRLLQSFGEKQPPRYGFVASRVGLPLNTRNTSRKFSFLYLKCYFSV